MADFDLGRQTRTLLAQQATQDLNLGRLFNQLQDLLGADTSLRVPLRDLFGREVFRKLLMAKQLSQKLAFKAALVQDLQTVYSPSLVARLEAFLNGLIGSEADEQTSQLQPSAPELASPSQPVSPPSVSSLPGGVTLKGQVDADVATVMASDLAPASTPVAAGTPVPAAGTHAVADASPATAARLVPVQLMRPLLMAVGATVVVLGVVLISSRRACPAGMQCSLASSFGLIKLSESEIQERYAHIRQQRGKAEFVPDLENRRREVAQLQDELKRGGYSATLTTNLQTLDQELAKEIDDEQKDYNQYKLDEAVVSSIGVVKTMAEAKRLEAAVKRLTAIPKTSLVYKAARFQASLALVKLRPFVAEAKTAEMQKLMLQKAAQMKAKEAEVKADIAQKTRLAKEQYDRMLREREQLKKRIPGQNRPAQQPENAIF